jgi:putative transposase
MQSYETLKHTKWECKYHVVFIPKCRKKVLYGQIRVELGRVIKELAGQKECRVEEGHLMADHVHRMISIPPKYSVAQVMGYIKGKTAIHLARVYAGRRRSFVGQQFWARGYWVSTVGRDEAAVRRYIQEQEKEDLAPKDSGFKSVPKTALESAIESAWSKVHPA